MEVTILYFGMIAEAIQKKKETIAVPEQCTVVELDQLLKEKYHPLKKLSFTIALNQKVSSNNQILQAENNIALLPPFAGG